jgi:ComF family protein
MASLALPASLHRLVSSALDLLLPPRCLKCGATVEAMGTLCAPCWGSIVFLGSPCCACCGLPFDFAVGESALCGQCSRAPPPYARARAVMRYDPESRRLVLALKHGDRLHLAPALGRWMGRVGTELLADADALVPVPLHWTRLFARRYNQSAVLAQAIRAAGGPPVAVDWLARRRRTPSQGKRNWAARQRNVQGAFAAKRSAVAGKRIVLIDDVFTTGATVGECARVLRRAGAARVDVLTLARTVRQEG